MSKKTLIVCGHGQGDPGAIGNGYQEQERVRYLGRKLVPELNKISNVTAVLYDTSKDLFQQGNIEEVSKDFDEVIELHMDSVTSSTANGSSVLVFLGGEDKIDKACLSALEVYFYNRGFKDGSWLYNAVNCSCPYRLLEIGFISNTGDVKIFNEKTDKIAQELTKRIAGAIGEEYNVEEYTSNMVVSIDFQNDKYYNKNEARYRMKNVVKNIVYKDFECTQPYTYKSGNETKKSYMGENTYINSDYVGVNKNGDKIHVNINQYNNKMYFIYKKKN